MRVKCWYDREREKKEKYLREVKYIASNIVVAIIKIIREKRSTLQFLL